MATYTAEQEKELNAILKKLQDKASKLILSDYYDYISISELETSVLQRITNANTHRDINYVLWNSGVMESTLENIAKKIKRAKVEDK